MVAGTPSTMTKIAPITKAVYIGISELPLGARLGGDVLAIGARAASARERLYRSTPRRRIFSIVSMPCRSFVWNCRSPFHAGPLDFKLRLNRKSACAASQLPRVGQ
jgi:hypothetical protein